MNDRPLGLDLEDLNLLSENDAGRCYSARRKGEEQEQVFVKELKGSALASHIRLQDYLFGLRAMYELDPAQTRYKIPQVIDLASRSLVLAWADGEPMAKSFERNPETALETYGAKLFDLFAYIDSKTTSNKGVTRYNRPNKPTKLDGMVDKLKATNYAEHIDVALIDRLIAYLKENLPEVETRFTYGNLQPGKIFVDATTNPETWTLIDCETCSFLWPRHYSAVNFVFNYTHKYPQLSGRLSQLLLEYLRKLQLDPQQPEAIRQINVSAALRCIGLLIEQLQNSPILSAGLGQWLSALMWRVVRNEFSIAER